MPPRAVRYTLGTQPNQPVSLFLARELFRLKAIANEPMECSICLDPICCDRCVCVLMCSHHFHYSCITQNESGCCPMCRK